uniref:Uncharacterized protein n=1 Tax=Cyclopterus lumpus TaxID=8103 RepID=A0A8C2WTW2_CYCLU
SRTPPRGPPGRSRSSAAPRCSPHVTNWALSWLLLRRRSALRHRRKLSSVVSEFTSTSMWSLCVHSSRPTSTTRMFRGRTWPRSLLSYDIWTWQ